MFFAEQSAFPVPQLQMFHRPVLATWTISRGGGSSSAVPLPWIYPQLAMAWPIVMFGIPRGNVCMWRTTMVARNYGGKLWWGIVLPVWNRIYRQTFHIGGKLTNSGTILLLDWDKAMGGVCLAIVQELNQSPRVSTRMHTYIYINISIMYSFIHIYINIYIYIYIVVLYIHVYKNVYIYMFL